MPRFRSRGKSHKDDNHDEVKRVFIDTGYHTLDTHMLNCGFDFIAWKGSFEVWVVEVKNDTLPASATTLTDSETNSSKIYSNWIRIGSIRQAINFIQNKTK